MFCCILLNLALNYSSYKIKLFLVPDGNFGDERNSEDVHTPAEF